ncbi:ABC transporter substrate-binding protein [Streptomyces sp. BRA346]|uniref:ABC transporter substrate-binding protein n=1 Tax=Streptomyces sp. BRA346 TaxID=2878199 RepID=UPI0040645CDA
MPIARPARYATLWLTGALTGALLLTGCGGGPGASSESSEDAPGYPRTYGNCGQKVRITAPPRQAVSLNQGSTEILLSLGLADRMAATATWTDPVLPGLRKANATVPRLADNAPSFEKVLDKEPDFVSASFESTLGKGGVATREQFEKLGVPTYVSPADCTKDNSGDGDGSRTTPLTMDDVYGEIRDLARVFGVEKRGDALVGKLKARVGKATQGVDASGTSVLYWFANSESPYMAGCCGAPGAITHAVGAKNVFDDAHEEWPQINWETVVERNPDVLVIGDLTRKQESAETAAKKIAFLESNPVTRSMDAVRHKRYVLLSGQAMNPSIRTVDGIEKVAAALRRFGLDR